ncbi:hypothetical protein [Campylobacter molothri]
MRKQDDPLYKKILLITEAKRQGTNDLRKKEGKINKLQEMPLKDWVKI